MLFRRLYSLQLTQLPKFNYNRRKPVAKVTVYDKERLAYNKLTKEYRKKNISEYWEYQTKIENEHIEEFLEEQRLKSIRKEQNMRDFTIYKTYQDTVKNIRQQAQTNNTNELLKRNALESDIRRMNRQQILSMLREESKEWFSSTTLNEQINKVVLPEQIADETDYYLHLQEQALYNDMGEFELLEQTLNQNSAIQWKNRLGMELFQQIVSIVKYLRQQSPYHRLHREWAISRSAVLNDTTIQDTQEILTNLDSAFQTLIYEHLQELQSNTTDRLEAMHTQLLQLYNLVELWSKYTQIIKLNPQIADQMSRDEEALRNLFEKGESANQEEEGQSLEQEESVQEEEEENKEIDGDEKATSSDEEDIDIEKLASEKVSEQDMEPTEQQGEVADDGSAPLGHHLIDKMINDSNERSEQDEERFEDMFKRAQLMYDNEDDLPDAREMYQGVNLENIFPREVIDAALNQEGPSLRYKSYDDIMESERIQVVIYNINKKRKTYSDIKDKEENLYPNPDIKRLQTMVVVEALNEQLESIKITNDRERSLVGQNKKLLSMIGEVRIDEPHLLIKLWRLHQ